MVPRIEDVPIRPIIEAVRLVVVPVRDCIEVDLDSFEAFQIESHQAVELFEAEGLAGNGLI